MHILLVKTKKVQLVGSNLFFEINNSHTLPFQKKSIHLALHLDLLDLLLKYRYQTRNFRRMASNSSKEKNRLYFSYDRISSYG